MTYKLYGLGPPVLVIDGEPVGLEMRKSLALLVYLRMSGRDHPRESLAALLWPEYDQHHALANLRRALASLKKTLLGEVINADREKIGLKEPQAVWLDVEEFHELLAVQKAHSHPNNQVCSDCLDSLEKAAQLYQGEFLEGFNLVDCPSFDEWQSLQRESLRQEYAGALHLLAQGYASRSDWDQAVLFARRWVAVDRLHEPAQRFLMSLLEQAGQSSAVLRQYDEFASLLRDELGLEPDPETTALIQNILEDTIPRPHIRPVRATKESVELQALEPVLKTKLFIPSSRDQEAYRSHLERQHLVQKLSQIEHYPLVILSAPAGFGKTSTLVDWTAHTSLSVAWYSLDTYDNEIKRFLNYLIAALDSAQNDINFEVQPLIQALQTAPHQQVLTHVIHFLEQLQEPLVLVIDDYQLITSQVVHEAVQFLLDHMPSTVHVILSTRADPPLRLARMRTRGQLFEIRMQDLRFSSQEAYEYLHRLMGLPLTMEDIARLDKKIEGWIAGLQMAALSMRNQKDLQTFIVGFSGTNRYILDYLLEEVMLNQPPEIQRFLLCTSVLDRLTAPLCDAVLADEKEFGVAGEDRLVEPGRSFYGQASAILEYLEKSNLFLVPLDDDRIWFRYHQLFADLLRNRTQNALGSQGIIRLHIRASDWHAQYGSILEAINHASAASDEERVERFIQQNYMELVSKGEQSWLRHWTVVLSQEMISSRPWLCIYEAYSHSWFGELDQADRLLAEAEKHMPDRSSDQEIRSMHGLLLYVKSRVTAMRGDLDRAIEFCLTAREYISASNLALQLDSQITLGYEYFLNGDYAHAITVLSETIRSGADAGAVINTVASACLLARLYTMQGFLHKSYDTYQKAALLIPRSGGEHLGSKALIEIGLAEQFYEWNDLESALNHVRQGLEQLPYWGKADDYVLACVILARIYIAQGNMAGAVEAVGNANRIIQTTGVFPECRHAARIAQVRLWLRQGQMDEATQWLEKYQTSPDGAPAIWRECEEIASVRVMLSQGDFHGAKARLAGLAASAESAERGKNLVEIWILQALVLQATGEQFEALEILRKALSMAQPEGFVRIFVDEGRKITSLLLQGMEQLIWTADCLDEYVSVLLNAFEVLNTSS